MFRNKISASKLLSTASIIALVLCLTGMAKAQPEITGVSPTTQHRSGFLEIVGTGFSTAGGVLVDGLPAITTTWTDTRIAAYVPEGSRLGGVTVVVENSAGSSSPQAVDVTLRQQVGRVQWRLRMDALYSSVRPARAVDGTIYAVDVYNRLYAVSPDGALKWVALNAGDKGVSVGPDGTIYTGNENWVKAFNPDGSEKWTFVQSPRAFIFLDVRVGPDGNIYAATSSGMGVFSLDPDGKLRWVTPEVYSRPNVIYAEIQFGPGPDGRPQLYFSANGHMRAIRLADGVEIFRSGTGSLAVSPVDGSLHYPDKALNPDGTLFWQFPEFLSGGPAIGPDGVHYATTPMITPRLYAISRSGTELWHIVLDDSPGHADVDPTGSTVIVASNNTLNYAGIVSAHDTGRGARLWRQELPAEEPQVDNSWTGSCGFNQFVDSRSIFTPGGETLYIMTAIATGNTVPARGFLYAIDTEPSIPVISSQLRSAAVNITAKARRGVRTITGQVDVVDENQSPVNDVTIHVQWTLPDGSTIDQVSAPSSGGGKGKKDGGGGGGGSFTIPDAGPGIYKLNVTDMTKAGYTFDACHGVLSESVYL